MLSRPQIHPLLLAAGKSERMGRPKPFLILSGRTFVEQILAALQAGGLPRVTIVTNPAHSDRYRALDLPAARLVHNPDPDQGMLSSLKIGLRSLPPEVTHAMVCLVDMPGLRSATVRELTTMVKAMPGKILIPTHDARTGHPTIFPRTVFEDLLAWQGPEGARGFIDSKEALVERIPVDDPGILTDLDTPDEFEEFARRRRGRPPR